MRTVPVRIPADVAARLEAEADARGIAPGWMAGRLLDEALGNLAPAEEFSLTRRKPRLPPVHKPDPNRGVAS